MDSAAASPSAPQHRAAHASDGTFRAARLAVWGAAFAFYALFVARTTFVAGGTRYFCLFEDAMISMRYARNFADGNGLVWNAGEPPVEGYTNFLWTLWMAAMHKVGLPESKVCLLLMLTGVAILSGLGLLAESMTKRLSRAPWAPLLALAATLFCYPLVFWTLRGMEVGALSLCITALLTLALPRSPASGAAPSLFDSPAIRFAAMGILGAVAVLIRSDAILALAVIGGYVFFLGEGGKRRFAFAAAYGLGIGLAVLAQRVYRQGVYHDTLPNTYYLKLLHVPFAARLKRGVFVTLEVLTFSLAVPIGIVFGVFGRYRDRVTAEDRKPLVLLAGVVVIQLAWAVYAGGDAWEWMLYANRYASVAFPALVVLVTVALGRLADFDALDRGRAIAIVGITVAGAGLLLLALDGFAKVRPEAGIARTIVFSKALAVGGVGLVLAGGAVVALAASLGRRALRPMWLLPLAWLPVHAYGYANWAARNAAQANDEIHYARLGLLLAKATDPTTRIAVVAAGATPYFSHRPSEDILGKNDAVIAHLPPKGVFSPGHDKWDYAYSLGKQNPAIAVELVDASEEDLAYIRALGFEEVANGLRVRRGAPGIDRELVATNVDDPDALQKALGTDAVTDRPLGSAERR